MENKLKISGIILSGGKSSRMGQEKGLTILGGKPLIEYSIASLQSLCSEIIICANTFEYDQYGYAVIADEIKGIGPISGIYSGLKASSNFINIVLSCDMPFVPSSLLSEMADNNNGITVAQHQNKLEPLAAIYPKTALSSIKEMIDQGDYKLRNLFTKHITSFHQVNSKTYPNGDKIFFNINYPDDLEKANKSLIM